MTKRDELERDYAQAAIKVGNLQYSNMLLEEQREKNDYEVEKLMRHMKSLAERAAKLKESNEEQSGNNEAGSSAESVPSSEAGSVSVGSNV